nr:MAG TPA: hypothetical protein [Caudoviricetes sp.]
MLLSSLTSTIIYSSVKQCQVDNLISRTKNR